MNNISAIQTQQLGKRYGNGVEGLIDLDLQVGTGEIFGLLGPNGSGKTTTVRLLNGTLSPTGGSATILGLPTGDQTLRVKTATLAEMARMYETMTVYDNLRFFGDLYDLSSREADARIEKLLSELGLWNKRELKLGSFSTGMKKRVQLARVLLHKPRIVFLDEPTAGLDPENAREVTDIIKNLAEENGTTVFMCTHNLALAERICHSFGFLSNGRMVVRGKKEEIIHSIIKENRVTIQTIGNSYTFTYEGEEEINRYIREVMDKGENIIEIERVKPSLEDVYFHYIGGKTDDAETGETEQ